MRAVFLVLLAFAGTTFAETRTTTVNVLFLSTEISTVTIKNIDKTATTYEYPCLQTSGGNTSIFVPSGGWSIGIVDPDPRSTPAPASPLNCTPYTFTQGPSTWAMTFTVPNVTYTADCTVHPDTIFSSLVRDCVSDYTYFGVIAQESIPADDVTNGMAPVTAVGDASFISTSSSGDVRPTTHASTSHSGRAGAVPRPTDAALGLGVGGAVGILGAALLL